jgi:protoporphyrinogen/coproporphyrinogen III oxidase
VSRPTVAVLGGGIAGLSAAWELSRGFGTRRDEARVLVLESSQDLGGKIRSVEIAGRTVDIGPDAFVARRKEALELCEELGLLDELVTPGTNGAYVWARGRLRSLPSGLVMGIPTRLGPLAASGICSRRGVARAALDLLAMPRREESKANTPDVALGPLLRRSLGREVQERLADPLLGGINAGSTKMMSTEAVLPQLLEVRRRGGSIMRALRPRSPAGHPEQDPPLFMTLRGGMQQLVDRLSLSLQERRVEVVLGANVSALERAHSGERERWLVRTSVEQYEVDGVVVALPAPEAASLLRGTDERIAGLLDSVPYASVTLVTFRFPAGVVDSSLEGTGFLVPVNEGRLLTACTWLSKKWPELSRPDDTLLRVSMGRFGDQRHEHMSDEDVVAASLAELREILGLHEDPLSSVVTRWRRSFPQYLVGHLERVAEMEECVQAHPSMALAGAYLRGVGIPACIDSGRVAARAVLEVLKAPVA